MISRLSFLALLGLALLIISLFPVTSIEEVINTSFPVSHGTKYGPNDPGTSYHTRIHFIIFDKSVLKGYVNVEGGSVYLTVNFYNTEHLNNIYVEGQYNFTVDPADDLYVFVFDNTRGHDESLVSFILEEVWTRPFAISSPLGFVVGLMGFFSLLAVVINLVKNHWKKRTR